MRSRGARASSDARRSLPLTALGLFEALSQHRLLDRLIRGRVWIGIVAFALIGIVTLQLGLLKLNGGIGRALERAALLQRQNATLSIENSEMASSLKIEQRAPQLGMAFATTGQLRFLGSRPNQDPAKAAAALASAARTATATEASSSSGDASQASSSEPSSEQTSSASTAQVSSVESSSEEATVSETGSAQAERTPEPAASGTGTGTGTGTGAAAASESEAREPASVTGASEAGATEARTALGG